MATTRKTALNGLLVIDKPLRMTSRDAVNLAWRWLPRGTRIGHCGTLDPLATGVLVVCAGAATRLAEYVQRMEKVYRAGIRLGMRSTTDDGEGALTAVGVDTTPEPEQVSQALTEFLGIVEQVPPDHSAAKVMGRRAYALARQGKEVELAPRPVMIHAINVLAYTYPRLDLEVRCGKGTYIRALARDLGERLGCGAYLEGLRRTSIGHFRGHDALALDANQETALGRMLPLEEAVRHLPSLAVADDQVARLQTGQGVTLPESVADEEEIALMSAAGKLIAVGRADLAAGIIFPLKVLV